MIEYDYFQWDNAYNDSVWPLMTGVIGFLVFWILTHNDKINGYFQTRFRSGKASAYHFIFSKLSGVVFLGIIPTVFSILYTSFDLSKALRVNPDGPTVKIMVISTLVLGLIAIPLVAYSASKPENLKLYPQIREKNWTLATTLINISGWSAYLLAYELLFRGILLFPLIQSFGLWPAIAVNTALYSTTHIAKGLDEAVAAIPTGIILCVLTVMSGNIWIAVIVHLIIALTNSFSALHHNKEFEVKWRF